MVPTEKLRGKSTRILNFSNRVIRLFDMSYSTYIKPMLIWSSNLEIVEEDDIVRYSLVVKSYWEVLDSVKMIYTRIYVGPAHVRIATLKLEKK